MNIITADQLTVETFWAHLKTNFSICLDAGRRLEFELVEVASSKRHSPGSSTGGAPAHHSFSLLFKGPDNQFLPQGNYLFEQTQIGQFELFLVPVGREAGSFLYEVIFNRSS
jgi:hypothetical protein